MSDGPKKTITRWQDIWLAPVIVVASLIPLAVFYSADGWWFWLSLAVAVAGIGVTVVLVYARWRYWPRPGCSQIAVVGVQMYVSRHKVMDPNAKPIAPNQAAEYRQIVTAWWENPGLTIAELANRLHVSESVVYQALRAWRLGQLDDRSAWQRFLDRLKMRHLADDTRYRP